MSRKTKNASDVVRMVEEKLALAALLRKEITRLSALCEENEKAARSIAISHLGDEKGDLAYQLALATLPTDRDRINKSVLDEYRHTLTPSVVDPLDSETPVAGGSAESHAPEKPRAVEKKPVATRAKGRTLFGVQVPLARQEEAEAIVTQAKATAREGGRKNPYQGDRGKNAWRKKLFNAAYDFEMEVSKASASVTVPETPLPDEPALPERSPPAAPVRSDSPAEQTSAPQDQRESEPEEPESEEEVSVSEEVTLPETAEPVETVVAPRSEPPRHAESEEGKARPRPGLGIPIPGPTSLTRTGSRPPIPSFLRKTAG